MSRLAAAVMLLGSSACTNWHHLECDVRMACDGGLPVAPLVPVSAFEAQGGAQTVDFVRGGAVSVVAVSNGVFLDYGDGGTMFETFSEGVAHVDALGTPTHFWILTASGSTWWWTEAGEPHTPGSPPFDVQVTGALSEYTDGSGNLVAAAFGNVSGSISVVGVDNLGAMVGQDSLACDLSGLDVDTVNSRSTGLLVGLETSCPASGSAEPGYGVAFFPREGSNTVSVLPAPAPSRILVSSDGDVATILMEIDDGVAAALGSGGAVSRFGRVLDISTATGESQRGFLEDVVAIGPTSFAFVLTNRNASPVELTPVEDTEPRASLAPQSSVLIWASWSAQSTLTTAIQLLDVGAPLVEVRLARTALDPGLFVEATCAANVGSTAFCTGTSAHHFIASVANPGQ